MLYKSSFGSFVGFKLKVKLKVKLKLKKSKSKIESSHNKQIELRNIRKSLNIMSKVVTMKTPISQKENELKLLNPEQRAMKHMIDGLRDENDSCQGLAYFYWFSKGK